MDSSNSQTDTASASREPAYAAGLPAVTGDASSISWTASNTNQANQSIGKVLPGNSMGHGGTRSVGDGKDQETSMGSGQGESERRHSDFHPPLLPRSNSQLPGFLDLISSVDDPNDKNRIPPISFPNEGSSHAANSSPIRKQYICTSCKKAFPTKNSLSKHKQIHGERSHICSDCNAKFHTKKDLTRHRDTVHGENSTSYICPVPDCPRSNPKKAFSRRDNLRQHIIQLHDKKYLDDIRNPQATSPQAISSLARTASKSPEESGQNGEDMQTQTIDEVLDTQEGERDPTRSRSPVQVVMGEADSDNEPQEDDAMAEGDGRDKDAEETLRSEYPQKVQLRSHSPYDMDQSQDVVMTTPGIVVQDFGTVPAQEQRTETEISSKRRADADTTDDLDHSWVVNFLDGISAAELQEASKFSDSGLKSKFPMINTKEKLRSVRFALAGFSIGFQRGYKTAQAAMTESIANLGPAAAASKSSLSVVSPIATEDGKSAFSPLRVGFSPLTPTSLTSISPASPHIPKSSSGNGFFSASSRNDTSDAPRGEHESIGASRTASIILGNQEYSRVEGNNSTTTRPTTLATDIDAPIEICYCTERKCGKRFTKKSEFKKHMQRHRRPFYCTFHWQERGEVQRFGSKDDWRRHEEHRHYQSEFYKCPGGSDASCRGSWGRRQEYEKHLDEYHEADVAEWKTASGIIDEDKKRNFFRKYHNGTDYVEDNFWCGFCAKLLRIPPEMTGRRGKEIRVNHVADHFHKEQNNILEWVKYNECNLQNISAEIKNRKDISKGERERSRPSSEPEPETLEVPRNLPPIRLIVGNLGEVFNPNSIGPATVPEFWICCECKAVLQTHPDFAYALNLMQDHECTSNEHEPHKRCSRCSIGRSQS